jgi:hypothetical protein
VNGHAVMIVGRGPTGLMLAGGDAAIVERRASQDRAGMRAGGMHARTIEVLDEQALAYAGDVARAAQRRPALLTILTRRRRRRYAPVTFLTDLAAQDHRARWRSPQAARASRFSTRLSMRRTYYARVDALLPRPEVQGRTFARGR